MQFPEGLEDSPFKPKSIQTFDVLNFYLLSGSLEIYHRKKGLKSRQMTMTTIRKVLPPEEFCQFIVLD